MANAEDYQEIQLEKSATKVNMVSRLRRFITKYSIHILVYQISMLLLFGIISYHSESLGESLPSIPLWMLTNLDLVNSSTTSLEASLGILLRETEL